MTFLSTTLAIIGFIAAVAAHEIGHAVVLRRLGGRINEIGFGLPFGPRLVLKPTAKRKYTLSFSPFLVMAYVRPEEEDHDRIEAGPYKDYAWFSGVGIIINLAIAAGLLSIYRLILGDYKAALTWAGIYAIVIIARKFIVRYVVPAIAIPIIILVLWSLITNVIDWLTRVPTDPSEKTFIFQILVVDTPLKALAAIGIASLVLGVANMLPMRPLDGGRICQAVVERWKGPIWGKRYMAYTFVIAIGLEVFATLFYATRALMP